ncbi:methionyl-tRNA formyltransferase [Candidatus Gastranaerophilus sp. (ex Termes propinquus)]|nr:methionyl-tRNA formyltransferase [Candidatus Gastranaerophilus sp. (ex Termes propinquus)]
MSRKKKILARFEQEILSCKKKLKELEPHIKHNASIAVAYNRKLVEKAILVDRYKKLAFRPTLTSKIRGAFSFQRPKLICDFFQDV